MCVCNGGRRTLICFLANSVLKTGTCRPPASHVPLFPFTTYIHISHFFFLLFLITSSYLFIYLLTFKELNKKSSFHELTRSYIRSYYIHTYIYTYLINFTYFRPLFLFPSKISSSLLFSFFLSFFLSFCCRCRSCHRHSTHPTLISFGSAFPLHHRTKNLPLFLTSLLRRFLDFPFPHLAALILAVSAIAETLTPPFSPRKSI